MPTLTEWDNLRRALRDLHRALAERASRDFLYARQRIDQPSPGDLLQMLTKDPEFAWLRGLSELIVEIDVARDDADTRDDYALGVRSKVERFISPPKSAEAADEFARCYWPYVQEDPHVAMAHGAVKRVLGGWARS